MRLLSNSPKPDQLNERGGQTWAGANTDLAFRGDHVFQGNFAGFQIWDATDKHRPVLSAVVVCPTDQGDVSIHGDLLFISTESLRSRVDCGSEGVNALASATRMRGVRIWDVSDESRPRPVANVQTCRGSHTHTLVPDPGDKENLFIYVSGFAPVRPAEELAGCTSGARVEISGQRIPFEVIAVPLLYPARASVVSMSRAREDPNLGRTDAYQPPGPDPKWCHDITAYPEKGLAAAGCGGFGVLFDISSPMSPTLIGVASDSNFAFWHSATFNNDATTIVFSDEWGGGAAARCRVGDPRHSGANTVITMGQRSMTQRGYFKLPAVQSDQENCVAHNGALIPVPGRDIMVQGWYQGGVSVFDFSDPDNPEEIAFFDRGSATTVLQDRLKGFRNFIGRVFRRDPVLAVAGSWSAYWYNGFVYSSEVSRGLDILELVPTEHLTKNELDAARLVVLDQFNPQSQPEFVWPAAFPVVRSYLDQLGRGGGLSGQRAAEVARQLAAAEQLAGSAQRAALLRVAEGLARDANASSDPQRVRRMVEATRNLAAQGP